MFEVVEDLVGELESTQNLEGDIKTSFPESDPTVPKHVKAITQDDINNWNNETDPTVPSHVKAITEEDIEKWNKGGSGSTATIEVGTTTTGEVASVTNVGTETNAIFNFVIPKGETGPAGKDGVDGTNGKDGNDYVLTSADKQEIAELVLNELPNAEGVEY